MSREYKAPVNPNVPASTGSMVFMGRVLGMDTRQVKELAGLTAGEANEALNALSRGQEYKLRNGFVLKKNMFRTQTPTNAAKTVRKALVQSGVEIISIN